MRQALLISELLSTPWAMQRERLAVLCRVVARWAYSDRDEPRAMDDDDWGPRKSAWELRKEQARALAGGGIGVLPLYGTIVQRAGMVTNYSGGTSAQQFAQAFRDMQQDPGVSGILIDIDSPGGSVYGTFELADEIYGARGQKPVYGFVNSLCASAAYAVGAVCDQLFCTPGGESGSIGVWTAHEDWSKALDEMGVKMTLISAGKYKTEGNPYEPLSDEAQAYMQKRVDDYYQMFTKTVAKGRGKPIDQVRSGMGQGRVLGPADAKSEGMIDDVDTFDGAVKRLAKAIKASSPASASYNRAAHLRRQIDIASA